MINRAIHRARQDMTRIYHVVDEVSVGTTELNHLHHIYEGFQSFTVPQ